MPHAVSFELIFHGRAGAHQRHFADQHIPELRQFIETGLPRIAPTQVTRGSFCILKTGCSPFFPSARTCPAMNRPTYSWWMRLSQLVRMERNFSTVNFLPYWPRRSWRKSTGPLEVALIRSAISPYNGESRSRAKALPAISMARLRPRASLREVSFLTRSG